MSERTDLFFVEGTCEEDGTIIDWEIDDVEDIVITTKHDQYSIKGSELLRITKKTWKASDSHRFGGEYMEVKK